MKNWKTTLAGVIITGLTIATSMGWISVEVAAAVTTLATAFGFIVAKDNNVTGK